MRHMHQHHINVLKNLHQFNFGSIIAQIIDRRLLSYTRTLCLEIDDALSATTMLPQCYGHTRNAMMANSSARQMHWDCQHPESTARSLSEQMHWDCKLVFESAGLAHKLHPTKVPPDTICWVSGTQGKREFRGCYSYRCHACCA